MPYDDDNKPNSETTNLREQFERLKKQFDAEKLRADQAERQLAFSTAGIKLDDPKMKYFVNGYDGEIEADKIRAAALEAGFLAEEKTTEEAKPENQPGTPPAETQQQTPPVQTAEQFAFQQIDQATTTQDTSGINYRAGMEDAVKNGGIDGMTAYMRRVGLPVAAEQD